MDLWTRLEEELNLTGKHWRWLGAAASIPESTLSRWRDKGSYPSVEKAIKIAQAVGRSVEYLVTGKDPTGLSEKSMKIALAAEELLSDEGKDVALTQVKGLVTHFPASTDKKGKLSKTTVADQTLKETVG